MKLHDIAEKLNLEYRGIPNINIQGCASLEEAQPGDISFVISSAYKTRAITTQASALIAYKDFSPGDIPCLHTDQPYLTFARCLELFEKPRLQKKEIHPTAVVDAGVSMGTGCSISAYAVIGESVQIGSNVIIYPHVVIYPRVIIGDNVVIHSHVSIRESTIIGNNVIIHNGVVIGSDGFGFAEQQGCYYKIPQLGGVVIADNVEIGANTTIDRATLGTTVISEGTKIDNLVQIAHNVKIGKNTAIAAQVGIAGSTTVGNHVKIGGQVGITGHIDIGDQAGIMAKSGVTNSIEPQTVVAGYPAIENSLWRRACVLFKNFPHLLKRMTSLEQEVAALKDREKESIR